MVALSFCGIIFVVLDYFFLSSGAPRGITSLLVLFFFLGGVQLLALSIIAEYIGRIFEEIKRRPTAIIRDVINDHRSKEERNNQTITTEKRVPAVSSDTNLHFKNH